MKPRQFSVNISMLQGMSITVEVLVEQGRPVVVKRADGTDIDRVRSEGDRLRLASHPGVVQLVSSAPSAHGWELRTVHAGRPVDVAGPLTVGEVAALAAGLATTLADLHAAGIVHGRVEPSHVLVGSLGRPVLCGFGMVERDGPAEPADDVAGVGSIVTSLLGADGDAEPIPERRWRRRPRWSGWERRALLTLADQACAEPATRRPTARRLAAAITDTVPSAATAGAEPPGARRAPVPEAEPDDPLAALRASAVTPTDRPAPRARSVVAAAIGVAALALGVHRSTADSGAPRPERSPVANVSPPDPDPLDPPTTMSPSTVPASCGPVAGADLDGDGCREAVTIDGQIVSVGEERFQVGQPGDHVAVRDWDCDGQPTPALLRPSTGEVFLFARWDRDSEVVVQPIATVVGGTELVISPASATCSGLSVRTPDSVVDIVRGPA